RARALPRRARGAGSPRPRAPRRRAAGPRGAAPARRARPPRRRGGPRAGHARRRRRQRGRRLRRAARAPARRREPRGPPRAAGGAEVKPALSGATGSASRLSATVGRPLSSPAIPAGGPAGGAIRVADDLPHLEGAISHLRRLLVAAGALGLAVALLLSYAVTW